MVTEKLEKVYYKDESLVLYTSIQNYLYEVIKRMLIILADETKVNRIVYNPGDNNNIQMSIDRLEKWI